MKTEITKSDLYGMTIANAQTIANTHKEDPEWDFWYSQILSSKETGHDSDDQNND